VTLAFAALLAADLIYQSMTAYGESDPATAASEALYLVTPVLLAAAATAPGADVIAAPVKQPLQRPTSVRVVALTVGVVTTPVLLLVVIWPDDRPIERLLAGATILVILLALMRIRRLLATVESQAEQLGRQARTDALTGLPNRRTLDYEVERTVQQATSEGQSLTVAMLDLDHFKSFNDQFGHQAGDALLRGAAQAWTSALPPGSFLARYGGEEFALLLPGVGGETAERLLEGLRAVTPPERTVSIGFAEWQPDETGYEALNRADRALYAAKAAGRDRVVRDNPNADSVSAAGRSPDRR
jgi:diguanylate cyclase (GGDEF)-like protein